MFYPLTKRLRILSSTFLYLLLILPNHYIYFLIDCNTNYFKPLDFLEKIYYNIVINFFKGVIMNSICCKELPVSNRQKAFSAESGKVRIENMRGDFLDVTYIESEKTLVIDGTNIKVPFKLFLEDNKYSIVVSKRGSHFTQLTYPNFSTGITNVMPMHRYQLEELKRMLDLYKIKHQ